jgi:hypothetical protein
MTQKWDTGLTSGIFRVGGHQQLHGFVQLVLADQVVDEAIDGQRCQLELPALRFDVHQNVLDFGLK